jgi:hypothetical protein
VRDAAALQRPDLLAGRRPRTINMSTIGDDLLRETSPQPSARSIEALVVYNSNPVAVAPESAKVVAGFQRDDLFTVVLEHFLTDTADLADYVLPATTQLEHLDVHTSYGHTYVLINHPAVATTGPGPPNTEIFRAWPRAWASTSPACRTATTLARQAVPSLRLRPAAGPGLGEAAAARAAVCRGRFPHAQRQGHRRRARPGRARLPAEPYESRGLVARAGRALPAGDDLAAGAQLPQFSSFVNVTQPAQHRGRAAARDPPRRRRRAWHRRRPLVRVFNDRGSYRCKAAVGSRARPGVVNGLGVWWRKLGVDGTNVNQLTSQRLTDIGRAPTFYDCLVEVEPG